MHRKRSKLIFMLSAALLISGCAYERAAQVAETHKKDTIVAPGSEVDALLDAPTLDSARYAFRLSDAYKQLGDTAASNRDNLAGGLIVVAGAAALGAVSSISAADVAIVGALGLGVNEVAQYTNQQGAASAFYDTSAEMACIASNTASFVDSNASVKIAETAIVIEYIRRTELRLRTRLRRTVPDFSALTAAFSSGLNQLAPQVSEVRPDLRNLLEACLPELNTNDKSSEQSTQPATGSTDDDAVASATEGEREVVTPEL